VERRAKLFNSTALILAVSSIVILTNTAASFKIACASAFKLSISEVCAVTSAFCSSRLFKSLSRPILIALTSDSTFLRVFGKVFYQILVPQQGTTFYTKYKNTPLLGTIILLFFIFIFRRGKKSKAI
jgi:hypothetical protein